MEKQYQCERFLTTKSHSKTNKRTKIAVLLLDTLVIIFCFVSLPQCGGAATTGQGEESGGAILILCLQFTIDQLASVACVLVGTDMENDRKTSTRPGKNLR